MAVAVNPQWGNTGAIIVRGFGKTDEQARRRAEDEGLPVQPGCLHSDRQFENISQHFRLLPDSPSDLRSRLDCIKELIVFGKLYREAEPGAKQINKTLAVLGQRLRSFIGTAEVLLGQPGAEFPAPEISEMPLKFRLPAQLTAFADLARKAQVLPAARPMWTACAEAAERLAFAIQNLDWVSEKAVPRLISSTPPDNSLSSLLLHARLLAEDVAGLKPSRGGRRPLPPEYLQATLWLYDLYVAAGGRFTHTPRGRGNDDGIPHSDAGRFVLEFFQSIDREHFRPQMISTLLRQASEFRRQKTGCGFG